MLTSDSDDMYSVHLWGCHTIQTHDFLFLFFKFRIRYGLYMLTSDSDDVYSVHL